MIIAIDFDGTCVTHDYPRIGQEIGAVDVLRELSYGHHLILFTMRSDQYLTDAVDWFTSHGIQLYGINTNPTQKEWTNSPKAYANLYIDDAALGIPLIYPWIPGVRPYVDWKRTREMLVEMKLI